MCFSHVFIETCFLRGFADALQPHCPTHVYLLQFVKFQGLSKVLRFVKKVFSYMGT